MLLTTRKHSNILKQLNFNKNENNKFCDSINDLTVW